MTAKEDFIVSYFKGFNKITGVSMEEFSRYYDESKYSGYPNARAASVWESEGKSIYVLIRILKPRRILELGNLYGVSTNHILQAVDDNKMGEVVLVDLYEYLEYDKLHNRNFTRILGNSLDYLNQPLDFDLIIQDTDHTYDQVKAESDLILRNNAAKEYYIWSHDYYSGTIYDNFHADVAWQEKRHEFQEFEPFKESIAEKPCGFLITKKINP